MKHYYNSISNINKLIELEITKNLVKEKYKEDLVYDVQNKSLNDLVQKWEDDEKSFLFIKGEKMRQIRKNTSECEKNLKTGFAKFFSELSKMKIEFVEVEEKEKKRIEDLFINTNNKNNNESLNLLVNFDFQIYSHNYIK